MRRHCGGEARMGRGETERVVSCLAVRWSINVGDTQRGRSREIA